MFSPSSKLTAKNIEELYYITDIDNVPSILEKGILSHNDVANIPHVDISDSKIQAYRKDKFIKIDNKDETLPLWSCVCLFAQPHNAMMHVSKNKNICIIRIDKKVLKRNDVYISDRNASCHNANFFKASDWALTDDSARCLYSRQSLPSFTSSTNLYEYKSIRQLEVLCPKRVSKNLILGFFVKAKNDMATLAHLIQEKALSLSIMLNANIFFLSKSKNLATFIPLKSTAYSIVNNDDSTSDDPSEDTVCIESLNTLTLTLSV